MKMWICLLSAECWNMIDLLKFILIIIQKNNNNNY